MNNHDLVLVLAASAIFAFLCVPLAFLVCTIAGAIGNYNATQNPLTIILAFTTVAAAWAALIYALLR